MLRRFSVRLRLVFVVCGGLGISVATGSAAGEPLAPPPAVVSPTAASPLAVPPTVAVDPAAAPAHDQSPAARADRQLSTTRFAGLAPAAAISADQSAFPELVGARSWRALDLPVGSRVSAFRDGDHVAEVLGADGRRSVLTSTAPLRARDQATGALAPVDLGLVSAADGFRPVNAATDVRLGATASAGVGVGAVSVTVAGAGAGAGTPVGDTIVWPGASADTDVVGQAVSGGVELSLVLRSIASPADVDLAVSMPDGASLREQGQEGDVAVVDGSGQPITTISAPVAWDADHVPVPVTMAIDGTHLRLHVDVAGRDIAWPVIVDPTITDVRIGCSLASAPWEWHGATAYYVTDFYGDGGWGCGMYQRLPNPTYVSFPAGVFSWWQLSLYGRPGAHIQWVRASGMNHDSGANAIGGPATCTFLNIRYDDAHYEYPWSDRCDTYRSVTQEVGTQNTENGSHGDQALVGLHTVDGGIRGYFQQSVAGLETELGDYGLPSGTITGPTGWQRSRALSFDVSGADDGLGVRTIDAQASGYARTVNGSCPWSLAICNPTVSGTVSYDNLSEGRSNAQAIVTDAAGNSRAVTPAEFKVDVTPPTIALSGALYAAREDFVAGSLGLTINATDGSTSSASAERSGVKRIEVYVNDFPMLSTGNQTCAAGSCPRSTTYTFDPAEWPGGDQEIRVRVYDQLDHYAEQRFTVYTDETHDEIDMEDPPASGLAALAAPVTLAANPHTIVYGLSDQKAAVYHDPRLPSLGLTTARYIAEFDTVIQALGATCGTPGPSSGPCYLSTAAPNLPTCPAGMSAAACKTFRQKSPQNALRKADRWMAATCPNRSCGSNSVLVSFAPDDGAKDVIPPAATGYADGVRAFRQRYPYVTTYTAWNEPNCCEGLGTENDPAQAADLYLQLRSQCTAAPTCTVAAGDLLDSYLSTNKHRYPIVNGNDNPDPNAPLQTYLSAYKARLKAVAPTVVPAAWAIHAYTTANSQTRAEIDYFVQQTQTDPTAAINSPGPNIWLTEQGGLYRLNGDTYPRTHTGDPAPPANRGAVAVRYLVGNTATGAEGIVNHYTRVTRFYLYHWRGSLDWDSGLTQRSGATGSPPITPVRPEFYCYRFVTNPQTGDSTKCTA
ncbi:MAG: hypothetical protein JWQ18_225 [Conexibacter sp.]|nr:hypothetical protein [Conexibacter sp.]